jgi:Fe-S cluster assembly protein SufD
LIESLDPSLKASRTAAFERFEATEMPTQKLENWKYVDLGFDLKQVPVAIEPGAPLAPGPFLTSIGDREASVVVIDGTVTSIESGEEATVLGFDDLDASSRSRVSDLISNDRDVFAAARSAFAGDAVVVVAPRGVSVAKPVVIDLQATSATASYPRVTVIAEENAEIGVVVVIRSAPGEAAVMSPQIGLHAESGARIRYVAVQNLAFEATAVVHQKVEIGRDATVRTGEVGLGGKLGRQDLEVALDGQGSSAEVLGVYFGEYDQTLDYRMVIHHKGKNSSSDVFLKGAVEDNAQSVFTGLLKIDKGAERTSAFETNRNLVLSEGAKAHSVPNLEIECDDVVCGHGSSVGPLETEHLYYLRSRGLSAERAERLMIKGFFNEIIDRLPVAGLAEPVRDELFGRFIEAQREGRVA